MVGKVYSYLMTKFKIKLLSSHMHVIEDHCYDGVIIRRITMLSSVGEGGIRILVQMKNHRERCIFSLRCNSVLPSY